MQKTILKRLDFTIIQYEELCQAIAGSKYASATITSYLQSDKNVKNKPFIILRHDIDQNAQHALHIAQIEKKYDLKATYYFRLKKSTYIPQIIDEIASYGHEVGYHYETLDTCKGNMESAIKLFKHELSIFRERYNVNTVCAHGNPLTRYDNKDIWKHIQLSDCGLLGEAFLSLDFRRFAYFSDSGRTWVNSKAQKMLGKDDVTTAFDYLRPRSTYNIIKIINDGTIPNICVLTHCERWSDDIINFSSRYLVDLAFSWGKVAIYFYRWLGKRK